MTRTRILIVTSAALLTLACEPGGSGGGPDWRVGLDGGDADGNAGDTTNGSVDAPADPSDIEEHSNDLGDASEPVTRKVEYYFVIDGSGSKRYREKQVPTLTETISKKAQTTDLKYRIGVTNMQPDNEGRLVDPPGWHYTTRKLKRAVESGAIPCRSSGGGWKCSGSKPHGLEVAREGIRYLGGSSAPSPASNDRLRSEARLVVVFVTDEAPASVESGADVDAYRSFFEDRAKVFAVKLRSDCNTAVQTGAYKTIAVATGGKYMNVCVEDLSHRATKIVLSTLPSSR